MSAVAGQVCILGTGASGLAAARLLSVRDGLGGRVCSESEPGAGVREAFAGLGFAWDGAGPVAGEGLVVVSPGFAADHAWVVRARELGAVVRSEAELGAEGLRGRILAVTGSLGKTTTVMLAAEVLRAHGLRVTLSGNIGLPVCAVALECPEADWHVLELSSFQTELFEGFRAEVGLLLNLVPNHLDRHGTMAAYARAKARMFCGQRPEDVAVIPEGLALEGVGGTVRRPEGWRVPDTRGTGFDVPAYRENVAVLLTGLADVGLDAGVVRRVMEGFEFPPHRMQVVSDGPDGLIVDDSKSTCLTATLAAMRAVMGAGRPLHLVMGGVPKGDGPELLGEAVAAGGVSLYLFGLAAEGFAAILGPRAARCEVCGDLEEAMRRVFLHRNAGETLLFSPGCASFDQYSSYMERGQHFQHLVGASLNRKSNAILPDQEKS